MAASLSGETSKMSSVLWEILRDILPTPERMKRINQPSFPSAVCTLYEDNEEDNSDYALLTYS